MPRVLLVRDAATAATPEWTEIERRLPQADRIVHRRAAALCLEEGPYELIIADAVLPDGGALGLLGTLITRHHETTVVVHFRVQNSERWLKLFQEGEFDLQAEPMTSEAFFRWLGTWRARTTPAASASAATAPPAQR